MPEPTGNEVLGTSDVIHTHPLPVGEWPEGVTMNGVAEELLLVNV